MTPQMYQRLTAKIAGTPEELRAATGLGELEDVFMAATRATAAQNMAPPALELVAD